MCILHSRVRYGAYYASITWHIQNKTIHLSSLYFYNNNIEKEPTLSYLDKLEYTPTNLKTSKLNGLQL